MNMNDEKLTKSMPRRCLIWCITQGKINLCKILGDEEGGGIFLKKGNLHYLRLTNKNGGKPGNEANWVQHESAKMAENPEAAFVRDSSAY